MTRDEIREIAEIVGGDSRYRHFVHRINKEFDISDESRNANVYVLFEEQKGKRIGFCVLGHSPNKMKTWEKVFKEEDWVNDDFMINNDSCFELMYMYTRPEERKKGHGGNLLGKANEFARKKGAGEIYAYVSDTQKDGLDFYKGKNAQIIQDFSDEGSTAAFLYWRL